MEEFFGFLVLALAVIAAVGFALWVAAAVLARIFAWLLVVWAASFAAGLVLGILVGVVLPPRVLRGRTAEKPQIATPDAVVAGLVLGRAPKGHAKHFGWDRAWPVYSPHQATRDANAVVAQSKRTVRDAFSWLFARDPKAAWAIALLPALVGFAIGAAVSTLIWYLVMSFLGRIIHLVQQVGTLIYRSYERRARRRRQATLRCANCYRVTTTPSYKCSNLSCTVVHHDVRPGPLGIVHRRCGCGTSIPATVGGAAKQLITVCPFCLQQLPKGSGTRRVLPIPVIGAVGAGKTQFLSSAVVELQSRVAATSGTFRPISPVAEEFLAAASAAVSSGQRVLKTPWEDQPEGMPFVMSLRGRELEVQLIDAAGENFVDWQRSQGLSYIDTADVLLFVFDPFALPRVREQLEIARTEGLVPIAQGDPEDSYASVVDRLRAEDVPLGAKRLAIVLTKVDVLQELPTVSTVHPDDSGSIKAWLREHGADGFVRRVDRDFKQVHFFAVDSYGKRHALDPLHPVRVLDWALRTADPRLGVVERVERVAVGGGAA